MTERLDDAVARAALRAEIEELLIETAYLLDRGRFDELVEHYTADGGMGHRLAGPDAESVGGALTEWGLLTRLDHAAYMGRELAKAEAALRLGLAYRQDEPLHRDRMP